jgi:tRNA A-37 threonylcarbamoyl transferase component Bud32
MAIRPTTAQTLSPEDRQLIKSWLNDFLQSWSEERLVELVPTLPPAGDRLRLPALVEMVKIDLRRRWERGQRLELEAYLSLYPELGTPATVNVGLVRAEYEARQKAGTPEPLNEIAARFPQQAALITQSNQPMLPQAWAGETLARAAQEEDTGRITPSPGGPPAPGATVPRERIGRYRIIRKLGQGGMATVYLAHDEQLDREVALKVPKFDPEEGKQIRERFYREAKAAAALHHPNVCAIHEIGEIDGVPFLAMAFIDGRPLTAYIDPKGVSPIQAAILVRKVALALKEAHRLGIVHRDLKPGNIMLDPRKEPVIMDFGLARLERKEAARLTKLGAIIGTPAYMAPEQVRGDLEAMGARSDIYSLGIILYEMLAGRPPFVGVPTLVLGQVLTQTAPPPSEFRPNLDPAIQAICLKAIARKPDDRYASMEEFAAALGGYLKSGGRGQSDSSPTAPVAQIADAAVPELELVPKDEPEKEQPRKRSRGKPIPWKIVGPCIGAGVFLLLCIIAIVAANSGEDETPGPPPAVKQALRMQPISAVDMEPGGKGLAQIVVLRDNCEGPILVELSGLPDNIFTKESFSIPAGRNDYTLELVALPQAVLGQTEVKVTATLGDIKTESRMRLTVSSIQPPPPPPTGGAIQLILVRQLSVHQGESATWEVAVQRQRFTGPVEVRLEDLPGKITCKPVTLSAEVELARLEVTAAADAPAAPLEAKIVAEAAGGVRAEEKVQLIVKAGGSIELTPIEAVTLRPGNRVPLNVQVRRIKSRGDVQVSVEGLPENVVGPEPFTIPTDADTAKITLFARRDAKPDVCSVRVLARLGRLRADTEFGLTIVGKQGPLPVQQRFPVAPLQRVKVKRPWGPEQATGLPDTYPRMGDHATAWASATADGQPEWLLLEYDQMVQPVSILVYETFNPGALSKVSVFRPDGTEVPVWQGRDPVARGIARVPAKLNFKTNRVLLYINSPAVPGWNEIDAVGVIDVNGKVHWAAAAIASSTYADQGGPGQQLAPEGQ